MERHKMSQEEMLPEPIRPLSGDCPIDRVILGDETKTFSVSGILAYLDSPYVDYRNAVFKMRDMVPVEDSSGKIIGFANIERKGFLLVANATIDYSTPERLSIETKSQRLYMRMQGWISSKQDEDKYLNLLGKKEDVYSVCVESLVITETQPEDKRVPFIGDILL